MSLFNNAIIGASGQQGYQISRSVRLRASASAYFNRTPASASNRDTWTWSGWVKRGTLSSLQFLFQQGADQNNATSLRFNSSDTLEYNHADSGVDTDQCVTAAVFRDPSAWYHIVVSVDTTQATDTNRVKIYVNGSTQTLGTANYPAQNVDTDVNSANPFRIGSQVAGTPYYFDGYLTEVNFIDGQALTPSSFGEYNTITGVWQPKKYTGTYGTNGFYLNFSDPSAATAAAIGKDYSGNGNNWTPNNISVTSGVTYDSMLDVPTMWADGGNGRGNYAVMNPLDYVAAAFSGTASNGNLTVSIPAPTNSNGIASSIKVFSTAQPKFYIETTVTALTTFCSLGMISGTGANYRIRHTQDITINVNDVIMTAFDPATGNIWYGRNGTWLSSGNPSAGTNPYYTIPSTEIVGSAYCVLATNGSTGTFTTNTTFGQQPFTYTPPTGFKALNTQNLPTPTILNGAQYMAATLYTGNGTTTQSISNAVNGVSFRPDFVWNKTRSNADDHRLVDVVRGGGTDLSSSVLYSNLTNAQDNSSGYITQTSNGFNLGVAATPLNMSGRTYVAWQWNAGGTGSSNTSGSITSTVSVNATAGFSIVTYTGTGANATVGHGLGVAPSMIIVKCRSNAGTEWPVYHTSLGATKALVLEATSAAITYNLFWNNTAPTSSVFSIGAVGADTNINGATFVAYCFSAVAGYSAFGSYTGNGSTDGPFVFCGFRPRYVMIKGSSFVSDWDIQDAARNPFNTTNRRLWANLSNAETTSTYDIDFLSNGFKVRTTNPDTNTNGGTIIFAAFAENPFKNSLAR